MIHTFKREVGGRDLTIELGRVAGKADGAVILRYGDSMVLVTACVSQKPREGVDFFPLTVDYEERLYAAGKIPGSFFRREGRPTSGATLTARLTDRPLRPLFPKGFRRDVQIVVTVLSADQENDPDMLSIAGASAALSISRIPFAGPVSAVRVGLIDGQYVINPTFSQLNDSSVDLVVAGTKDAVMMVEAGSAEVSEEVILGAIRHGQDANRDIIAMQEEMVAALGQPKVEFEVPEIPSEVSEAVGDYVRSQGWDVRAMAGDGYRDGPMEEQAQLEEALGGIHPPEQLVIALNQIIKDTIRNDILEEGRRPDGRAPNEIRPLSSEVGLLPRTHGSGLFTRGQTQVLTIATLGSMGEQQKLDTIEPEDQKRFIHHYNFPPFSVGEAKVMRGPSRRDIGHGALAERALQQVIPSEDEFPYTIRLVSEVLSSNGSTSMASTCGSTLSLMDAGVPISAPVAGVAMGLIKGESSRYAVLSDIAGVEDALGDMDFKVAGTSEGITALQMDIKVKGITFEIMEQALAQAREGRLTILNSMLETIPSVRSELSRFAPRMLRIQIPQDKIGAVIGPGGKMIRSIIEETKCSIDVSDDGVVFVGSPNEENARKAVEEIEALTKEAEVGDVYTGNVTRLVTFGAFVEILPGKEGLVRLEDLADYAVDRPEDIVKVGDEIMVMVIEVDQFGRVNLSRRAVLEGVSPEDAKQAAVSGASRRDRPERGDRGGPPRSQRPQRRDSGGAGYAERRRGNGRGPGGRSGGGRNFGRQQGGGGGRSQGGGRQQGSSGGRPQGGNRQSPQAPGLWRGPGEPPPPPPKPPVKSW